MGLQVLRVKGSKLAKKVANKQFKLLCADYNKVYKIIDTLKERGFELVTVSELVYHDNYTINNNGIQIKN